MESQVTRSRGVILVHGGPFFVNFLLLLFLYNGPSPLARVRHTEGFGEGSVEVADFGISGKKIIWSGF